MSEAKLREQVTLSTETIHNPDEPRHFMRVKTVKGPVRILFDGRVLAQSDQALRVLEAGKDLYDPTIYVPPSDVRASLSKAEKQIASSRAPSPSPKLIFRCASPTRRANRIWHALKAKRGAGAACLTPSMSMNEQPIQLPLSSW